MRFTIFKFLCLGLFFGVYGDMTTDDEMNEITSTESIITEEQTAQMQRTTVSSTARISTAPISSTTEILTSETSSVVTPSTNKPDKGLLYECDFTVPCFAADQLTITDGGEFNADDLSEPPRGPSSDADSINGLTVNNGKCQVPFQPSNDQQNATWDMYFCYKNQCPVDSNGTLDTCRSGRYAFVELDSSTTMLTIRDNIVYSTTLLRATSQRCLRYWYYFTVYDGIDWGQNMELAVQTDDEWDWERVIDEISVADMPENRWHSRSVSFESSLTNFTFSIGFRIIINNQTQEEMGNRAIYFALDNIQFFDGSCDNETETSIPMVSSTAVPVTNVTEGVTNPTDQSKNNLALILGLTLGLGIPALLIVILAVFYFTSRGKKSRTFHQPDIALRSRASLNSTFDTRL